MPTCDRDSLIFSYVKPTLNHESQVYHIIFPVCFSDAQSKYEAHYRRISAVACSGFSAFRSQCGAE
ncbi:hypothetical protein YERSI8AC_100133 [Enterobacterales bacterium 8AC]|nr:hypothetical protein YERSI8AC_100133 [Enterobacterales bacterium 8AC]